MNHILENMVSDKEQEEYAKIPYTKKEIDDYNNIENPDFCLFCDCQEQNKVMIGSDFYCKKCHNENQENQ